MVHLNLSMIHPEQSLFRLSRVIRDIIHEFLRNRIDESSDILFMAKIGSMRDWTKDCSICLEDKIGDSNGWSGHHCQITLFRPCGHSLCTKCNKELTARPLCRETIIKYIKHNYVRFDEAVIDELTNQVMSKYKNDYHYY